jgi:hypothetical protein
MHRFRTLSVSVVVGVLPIVGGLSGGARLALGEDFRVDNAVYMGDQQKPSTESTTIFRGGAVYDFMKTPAETVIFDKTAGRFVLLNLSHQTRTELTTDQVSESVDRLQARVAKSSDPLAKFLAKPNFQEQSDDAAGELTLSSPWITYRVVLARQSNANVVEQYHEFSDWYARLNALLIPGSKPPFGRLVVNAALAQRQATASKVLLTISTGTGPKKPQSTVRSEHRLILPLEPADLERVAQARRFMESFKLVAFDKYRKLETR